MRSGLHADTISELNLIDGSRRWATVLILGFSSPINLTTWPHQISTLGRVFNASDHILSVPSANESGELRVGTQKLVLSGAEQTFIGLFFNQPYIDVPYSQYICLLDPSGVVIGAPIDSFSGVISSVELDDSGKSSKINVEISSHWADFEKKSGRKTNSGSQKIHFPDDLAFDFKFPVKIKWGKK